MVNTVSTTIKTLSLLNVGYTTKYIKDNILSHPEHSSLLAIIDTLNKYKIKTLAVNISFDKLIEMPLPCIIQVQINRNSLFFVLDKIVGDTISYYNDKNKYETISKNEFVKIWTGVCLLIETSVESKEPGIEKKLSDKRFFNSLTVSACFLLVFWVIYSYLNSEAVLDIPSILTTISYTVLKILGLTVGVFLLWFEVDQYNPTLQNFCSGGDASSKVNCNAVLGSKHAKLFQESLSLSLLVFSYFFSTLIYLLINNFSASSISILSLLSFISLPVVIASIYYQAFVIKQWCKFCIIIQIVIITEIALSYFAEFFHTFKVFDTSLLGFLFLIPIISWKFLKPLLENQKETNLHKRGLKKIKNNSNVLEGLLVKSRKIETKPEGLGISINNTTAKYHIIKVCNPYCGPCAKAHPILEELVSAGKISLQILFNARADSKDNKAKPVSHFLAIDSKGDKKKTQQALDDWYLAEQKDYEAFANKYPMNGELELQNKKIEAMRAWCNAENITHTPTIFINGYELPKEYSVKDLVDVLQ
ncbi:vitamin K epoxide reductase family protein [Flavivirga aquimarina]|uniref:Vitamin K epoxide reductase family protein n=1 Tax=Flavivirga aquimarina TaxID=2027862 RepID=A0ABT8W9C2_9FLAO|nr:vitamin K epoxide reductase family protein [Flavivirga aquimarina]MDO5969737.1 vitamin K epoxide reductase family protein [Flavivirga aquimarina]